MVMVDMKQIHDFAVKWRDRFRDPKVQARELSDRFLAEDCEALGFEMDCGHAFQEQYGEAASKHESLEKIIDEVTDIPLLGSAIFSQWRYFTHWAYDSSEIARPKNRAWFVLAFSRLAQLSEERAYPFQGELKEMRILSNNMSFGPSPDPDEEVEQHLHIDSEGNVRFSGYCYGNSEKARSKEFKIEEAATRGLFNAVTTYFGDEYDELFMTDIGHWEMELVDTEGLVYTMRGSLNGEFGDDGVDLSDLIRETVGMEDLFVFDGKGKPDAFGGIEDLKFE